MLVPCSLFRVLPKTSPENELDGESKGWQDNLSSMKVIESAMAIKCVAITCNVPYFNYLIEPNAKISNCTLIKMQHIDQVLFT